MFLFLIDRLFVWLLQQIVHACVCVIMAQSKIRVLLFLTAAVSIVTTGFSCFLVHLAFTATTTVEDTLSLHMQLEIPLSDTTTRLSRKSELCSHSYNQSSASTGYILAIQYSDQQTAALKNLLSLQCWAAELNMTIVEPFMIESMFGTPQSILNGSNSLIRFSDVFDMEQWDTVYVKPQQFSPFTRWEDFLRNAPRNVILVHIKQSRMKGHHVRTCSALGVSLHYSQFLQQHCFTIFREVCLLIGMNSVMTKEQFSYLCIDNYDARNITLIFVEWRGISLEGDNDEHTITVRDSRCARHKILPPLPKLDPSQRVFKDADMYIRSHLKNSDYIAIMVRLEYAVRYLSGENTSNAATCLNSVLDRWKQMSKETNIQNTFLSIDVGRFGSQEFQSFENQWKEYHVVEHTRAFFTSIYGSSITLEGWEQAFVDISGTSNPGYIAMLQKAIAIRAQCVILAGGGSFQIHALKMYRHLHPKKQCQALLDQSPCRVLRK